VADQTIADAINSVTDDVLEDAVDETTEEESTEEAQGSILDEEDDETEETEEDEAEAEEEPAEEVEEEEAVSDDPFDNLTAEELAEIKKNPGANKLRKALMRAYNDKTSKHSQLVQLGIAYRNDPEGVLRAMAQSLGMTLSKEQQAAAAAAAAAPVVDDPGKELEDLFGDQIGPKVRAVFDKWAEARFGQKLEPIEKSIKQTERERFQATMAREEVSFKSRHRDITPEIEKEIIDLGNSGKIVPGRGATPQDFLETLYEVVTARRSRQAAKKQTTVASAKLAKKIEANRRDREPSGMSGRGGAVQKVSKVAQAKSISEALDLAMIELENEE
jgi:hypothetical protein